MYQESCQFQGISRAGNTGLKSLLLRDVHELVNWKSYSKTLQGKGIPLGSQSRGPYFEESEKDARGGYSRVGAAA